MRKVLQLSLLLSAALITLNAGASGCVQPKLEEFSEDHPECLFYSGTAAFRMKNYEDARSKWQTLINIQNLPIDQEFLRTMALNNFGYLAYLGLGGDTDRNLAFVLWNQAVQRGNAEAAYHLCHAQADQGQPEFRPQEALSYCREALRRYGELANPDGENDQVVDQIKTYISRLTAQAPPNPSFHRTGTLFYFSGHSDLTEGVIDGDARATDGGPLRS